MSYKILKIDASSNPQLSTSKHLNSLAIKQLQQKNQTIEIVERDVSQEIPMMDSTWISASFTPEPERSEQQRSTLNLSDQLIDEIQDADEIILSTPMYNFSVPAGLKNWIDQISRVGKTFQYTSEGPQGLVANKPVTLIISTGGTPIGSHMDFVSSYLKQVFGFIGITDINVVAAEGMNLSDEDSLQAAQTLIDQQFNLREAAA